MMPSWSAVRAIAPSRAAGFWRASTAIRVARSRSSSGYLLGAAMSGTPRLESLHQTRHETSLAHPHVRGTCVPERLGQAPFGDPSPRAWGLPMRLQQQETDIRSIPTCVGPAMHGAVVGGCAAVHPHVRGACPVPSCAVCGLGGPSPRAWGLPGGRRCVAQHLRSIPTCVGPARPPLPGPGQAAVHPHVRGACHIWPMERSSEPGPSPRAWGLLRIHAALASRTRSIPTCVGPAPLSQTLSKG